MLPKSTSPPIMTSSQSTLENADSDRAYSPDDPYSVKGEWIRHDLLDMVPTTPGRVLSLGCGTGATESLLQKGGAEVWGIDVSVDAVEIARQRIGNAFVADVETAPLPELEPGSFDLVLCGDVLEHLRFTEHTLGRIHQWLGDDGHLVVAIPNATHYTVINTLVFKRNWRYEDGGLFDRGHYRLFTKKSLLRLLGEHGFELECIRGHRSVGRKVRVLHFLLRPFFWLMPFLNEYLVYTWTMRVKKVRKNA